MTMLKTGEASRRLSRHPDTLKAMFCRGEIRAVRTKTNRWLWGVDEYLQREARKLSEESRAA